MINLICPQCNKEFKVFLSRLKKKAKNIFCSHECRSKYYSGENSPHFKKRLIKKCLNCGKVFKVRQKYRKRKVCSVKCGNSGRFNANWKGGITNKMKLARNKEVNIKWRKAVFERDNYTCQLCGQKGNTLHVHHMKQFSENYNRKFFISEGITLCEKCHLIGVHWKNYRTKPIPIKMINRKDKEMDKMFTNTDKYNGLIIGDGEYKELMVMPLETFIHLMMIKEVREK